MMQSAAVLLRVHPEEFSEAQLRQHITNLLYRFQNKALGDTIFRVGCDLYRKLGTDDRIVAPLKAAIRLNLPCDLIFNAWLAGIRFKATDEKGDYFNSDQDFFNLSQKGIKLLLKKVSCLTKKEISANYP
jgi:mannitol-1-phosphate 5-dehydrogenase